jgi:hypothetical protein
MILVILRILVGLSFLYLEGPQQNCACQDNGSEPEYQSIPSDTIFPEPRVVQTIHNGDTAKIRITHDLNDSGRTVELESSDGGRHWRRLASANRAPVTLVQSGHMFYRYDNDDNIFERSRDGGIHWERPQFQLVEQTTSGRGGANAALNKDFYFTFSAVNPKEPSSLYGCIEAGSPQHGIPIVAGLYVSHDAGDHWAFLTDEVQIRREGEGCPLGISPANPDVMVAHGQSDIVLSRDGGKSWIPVSGSKQLESPARLQGYTKSAAPGGHGWPFPWTFLIVSQIQFLPTDPNTLFLVTNKGVYKTTDTGSSWCHLDTGDRKLFDTQGIYIDTNGNHFVIFVAKRLDILISDDAGCHFRTFFDWTSYTSGKG